MKTKHVGGASVRELKAAALDDLVKTELAKKRAAEASKMSGLKALRLAKEAEEQESDLAAKPAKSRAWPKNAPRKRSA